MTITLVGRRIADEVGGTTPSTPDPQPCVHYWQAIDRDEVILVCRYCRLTWSLDDPPDDGPEAA